MRICLMGGVRSGKSALMQTMIKRRLTAEEAKVLVVTFGRRGCDDEFDARIDRHQISRPHTWEVLELGSAMTTSWNKQIADARATGFGIVAVDCVGTLLSCVMDDRLSSAYGARWYDRKTLAPDQCDEIVAVALGAVQELASISSDCLFVTNEVGMAPVAGSVSGRLFVDCLGWVNRELVALCDKTFLVVAGRALSLGDCAIEPTWD